MEKNVSLSNKRSKVSVRSNKTIADLLSSTTFIIKTAKLFSMIMEERITPKQALFIINAMIALTMVIFPVEMPLLARIIFFTWLIVAAIQCKQSGLK